MDSLDRKILDAFPGKVVRKDLTNLMKKGANVPTYVLEYLLGMYCATDDEEVIKTGVEKIKRILSENYVRPDQSEYVKSKIKENGQYTVIDKITVELDDRVDKYIARFINLKMDPFEIPSDIVVHNEKLLIGGIWCIIKIEYVGLNNNDDDEDYEVDPFGETQKKKKKKEKKNKYASPFQIASLKPIQMPNLDMDEFIECRSQFTKEEWIDVLMKSAGYNPDDLTYKQKLHYLLRFVPFIQKNYNLVELGPRGTGKSHVYSELSPYSILMSSGTTTVSNMFYNMASRRVGLVGNWDCIAFDEVAGITSANGDMVQIMKNYMANGSFARGADSISSDASIAFEGNTFRSVADMMRTTNLFEPFPDDFNNDSAFFDRIHAYLPGWETPKLRASLFTKGYGLISDCFSEFCHGMRKIDFTNSFGEYFSLNSKFNTRDDTAVRRTFSGLAKLIYPDEKMTKDEAEELLRYCIECRRRVKEQLRKMNPAEFSDVQLGYIDNDTDVEKVVELPEISTDTLVFDGFINPGYVYSVGRSINDKIAVYRLENKLINGTGKLVSKNIEGLGHSKKSVMDSLNAAFNYFCEKAPSFVATAVDNYDYSLYFNDLQNRGVSDEVSVAEVIGLFSALTGRSVLPSMIVCGRVVMSGSMMPITTELDEIFVSASNAGAKTIMLPEDSKKAYDALGRDLKKEINVIFYRSPMDAVKKALGAEPTGPSSRVEFTDVDYNETDNSDDDEDSHTQEPEVKANSIETENFGLSDGELAAYQESDYQLPFEPYKLQRFADFKRAIVIDTNVLLNDPQFPDYTDDLDLLVIPKIVLQELDFNKKKHKNAQPAIKVLDSSGDDYIEYEDSYPQFISSAYKTDSDNDNAILSVAICYTKFSGLTTVLVTDDVGLKIKAKTEKVITLTPEQYTKVNVDNFARKQLIEMGIIKEEPTEATEEEPEEPTETKPWDIDIDSLDPVSKLYLETRFRAGSFGLLQNQVQVMKENGITTFGDLVNLRDEKLNSIKAGKISIGTKLIYIRKEIRQELKEAGE